MAINKVIYGNNTLIDLTSDTATEDKVLSGYTFHKATGEVAVGTASGGGDIPNGKTVTPTDDIQTWLHCAGIFDNNYTTLAEVLNDPIVYNALLSDSNACDYMARSTSWAGSSEGLVPTMTSNTTPSGECIYSSEYNSTYGAYHAFDNDSSISWNSTVPDAVGSTIGYDFGTPIVANRVRIKSTNNNVNNPTNVTIQGYDTEWHDIVTFSRSALDTTNDFNNNTAYTKYRMKTNTFGGTTGTNTVGITILQFYYTGITGNQDAMRLLGKYDYACEVLLSNPTWLDAIVNSEYYEYVLNTEVPKMTGYTTPEGTVSSNSEYNSSYLAWKAFDRDNSTYWGSAESGSLDCWVKYQYTKNVSVSKVHVQISQALSDVKTRIDSIYVKDANDTELYFILTSELTSNEFDILINVTNNSNAIKFGFVKKSAYGISVNLQFYGRTPANKTKYVSLVPEMTSNTTPSGVCSAGTIHTTPYDAWKAFDGGNGQTIGWAPATQSGYEWVQYEFTSPTAVTRLRISKYANDTESTTFKLQGSNNGNDFTDITSELTFIHNTGQFYYFDFVNTMTYKYYRIVLISSTGYYSSGSGFKLQFYRISEPEPAIIHCATDDEITIVGDDVETTIYAYGDTATLPADIPSGLYTFTSAVLSNPSYPDQPYTQNVYITEHTTEIYFMPENMETVLWTNPSPTSTFAAQTVTLSDSIENYKYIKVSYRVSNSNDASNSVIMSVEDLKNTDTFGTANSRYGSISGNQYKVRDYYYIDSTNIAFTAGYQINAVATDNNSCIPIEITGLNKLRTGKKSSKTTTTLWTNPNPTASAGFAAQNVTLSDDVSNYDYIEFEFFQNVSKRDDIVIVAFSPEQLKNKYIGSNWYGSSATIFAGNYYYTRYIRYDSETSMYISSGLKAKSGSSGSTFANSIIPNKIYGIKYE